MRRSIFSVVATLVCSVVTAQKSKSVFLEVLGNGGLASINFDSRLNNGENGLGYRVGLGFIPPTYDFYDTMSTIWTVPVGFNYLIGSNRNYLETGLGLTYYFFKGTTSNVWGIHYNDKGWGFLLFPSLGYRYAPSGKALQGRVFVSPLINASGISFYWGFSGGVKF